MRLFNYQFKPELIKLILPLEATCCQFFHQSSKRMFDKEKSLPRGEHLQRTSNQTRQNVTLRATLSQMENISPLVKKLTLKVHEPTTSFKAGQWVDFMIPKVSQVGGYSMCSSPSRLTTAQELQLAVKRSTWPPALWVHETAEVGSEVTLKIGGDFCYPNDKVVLPDHNLLLVAGGIGINPIFCILQHLIELKSSGEVSAHNQVKLLYSSKTLEELVFREDICSIADKFLQRSFFVTGSRSIHTGEIEARRINQSDIFKALSQFDSTKPTYCYICGPNQMILDVSSWLEKEGVLSKNIFYELWW